MSVDKRSKILIGARAKVLIGGKVVGFFTQVMWSIRQEKIPAYIIGRFNPGAIVSVAQEPVSLSLTGYRVVDAGPYKVLNVPMLKQMLNEEDFTLAVEDRQTKKTVFRASGCRVLGWSSGVASRSISDIRVDVMGIVGEDEYGIDQGGDEDLGAANIEDGT